MAPVADSWGVYRRLLGYTRRYWPVATVAVIGMLVDGGGLALLPACCSR